METVLLFVLGVVIILVGLLLSIALHELGHLIPAKLFGVRVSQYMIGFGKTLFSFTRGETQYGVKMLPLGGYIAMEGMFPPNRDGEPNALSTTGFVQPSAAERTHVIEGERAADPDDARSFYRLAVWKRVIIMLGGPLMNLVICVTLFTIMLMGIGVQQYSTTISSVSACIPAAAATSECSASDPLSPAKQAGLHAGDRIVSINGTTIDSWNQLAATIQKSPDRPLAVVVNRDGHEMTMDITPAGVSSAGENSSGKTETTGVIGIVPETPYVRQSFGQVVQTVGQQASATAGVIVNLPNRMVSVWNAAFGSGARDANTPMSIVGVGRAAGEVASLPGVPILDKLFYVLGILASLNMALFLFNLIPLPPLDGGHIAGALWEGLRRSVAKVFRRRDPGPVDMTKLMPVTFTVIVIFGAMSLLLMYADIVKPVNLFG